MSRSRRTGSLARTGRSPGSSARTGRRPGSPDTQDVIREAARRVFAERGYDGATVRGVAAQAGVDPALLYHYFGSKQQLFVAAMEIPYDWQTALPAILSGPSHEMGERLVRFILTLWESPQTQPLFLGAVRSAATDAVAVAMVRRLLAEDRSGPWPGRSVLPMASFGRCWPPRT